MTDFYRFPAMAKLDTFTNFQQVRYICDEAEEAKFALVHMNASKYDLKRTSYGMELLDVIHAAETALRIEFDDDEVDVLAELVKQKNRKRGYYDD